MNGSTGIKDLTNGLKEDTEETTVKKLVQNSGSVTISKSATLTGSCHKHMTKLIVDKNQCRLEHPVTNQSSVSSACKVGYWLENASQFGSAMLESCQSKKFSKEEDLKLEPDVTSAVREHVAVNGDQASKQREHGGGSQKRQQSRWEHNHDGETPPADGNSNKRRKTRWDTSDPQNGSSSHSGLIDPMELLKDPTIMRLQVKLMEINKKLQSSEISDARPEAERSPSPEPVYNNLGIRLNTRDARIRKKLMNERKHILSKIATKTNLTFKSSVKHKPIKFEKKLFIPEKEFPTYNFIGLILGPKGNTQKKMEKETGAKIFLRGKGSGDLNSSNEGLHVLVEARNQQALDVAAAMIEKLLIPVEDKKNEHKRAQLAELAKLRGACKDDNTCTLCKEQGHKAYACPLQDSTFKSVCCDMCGSISHSTPNCSISISQLISDTLQGSSEVLSSANKEVDQAKLYIGHMSRAIDERRLKELFLPFGRIINTAVIKDQGTGLSKGYGFVTFENSLDADAAVTYMNGYKMDGKMLAVRIAEQKPVPGSSNSSHGPVPPISGHALSMYSPVISMPPGAAFSNIKNESLRFPSTSGYSVQNFDIPRTESVNFPLYAVSSSTDPRVTSSGFSSSYDFCDQIPDSLPSSTSRFPGNPDYPGSQFNSYFRQQ